MQAVAAAADDFGHLVHHRPAAVVVPQDAGDVAAVLRRARRDDRPVAAAGRRHSVWGRAQAPEGIVLDMAGMRAVGTPSGDGITVEAGATWRDVLAATLPAGLTPPVLTDYLDLSVGGTISVGGVGGTTATHGVLADTVTGLDVVTGDGRRLRCSPERHAELFDTVRAGLGQVGVVVRATLRLVRAPQQVRRILAHYPDLDRMLADARLVTAERQFDVVRGAVLSPPGAARTYRLELVRFLGDRPADDAALLAGLTDDPAAREAGTESYAAFVDRLAELERALRASGQWLLPHPWLTTFVGDSRVAAVVAGELARLDPAADLGPLGQVVLSPIRRAAVGSPMLRLPDDPLCWAFNLIRLPVTGDRAEMARLVGDNAAAYRRVRDGGGTLYPVSAFPMTADDWRRHFGPAYDRLRRARERYDPAGLLTPGYDVF